MGVGENTWNSPRDAVTADRAVATPSSQSATAATVLAIVAADCFALINEQIVSPLGPDRDDRLLHDRNAGQTRHSERAILQLLRSHDFLRHGSGDLNHHHQDRKSVV